MRTVHSSTDSDAGLMPAATGPLANEADRRVAAAIGDIVVVLSRDASWRGRALADLHWMVYPAVASNQFALAYSVDPDSGERSPAAVVLWARVAESAVQGIADCGVPGQAIDEWHSGSAPVVLLRSGHPEALADIERQLSTLFTELRRSDREPSDAAVRV
jgi:hemolysin-activating ACP:hemolysin acyltransferase